MSWNQWVPGAPDMDPDLPFTRNALEAGSKRSDTVTPPPHGMVESSEGLFGSLNQPLPGPVTWPEHELPVEIFEIIISYISRAEIKNLRLVCREFESKVTAQYFRNVVVPFKSELYSTLTHDENGVLRSTTPLFSSGMRIFQSFGRHILRFALSLELDEDTLAYPPIKPGQQAVPSFWGVYRWPHPTYHRYTDLEGLEQTADETEAMKAALKCLSRVTNLGLCCDAGLGFLNGPDNIARCAAIPQPVFSTQNWRRTIQESDNWKQPIVTMSDLNGQAKTLKKQSFDNPISFKRSVLKKMVADAGYNESQIDEGVRVILETEGTSLALIDFDERSSANGDRRLPAGAPARLLDFDPPVDFSNHPLTPASLTRAQKEMLLELEWAHRAMIQSYVMGLIDNASSGAFNNLTTLTIAKIPSSHLHIFYRHELWGSLTNLNNVHLGVIADWRRISKSVPGCIDDTPVSPVEAVDKVFQLLDKYIGISKSIESLHFEWICGGEFAPGTFQRNHYVLPAPFFQQPQLMASPDSPLAREDDLLSLPFIKHLSLKNCWAAPHVFLETIRHMALSSLEKLELESVSLSGPPTTINQAPLHQPVGGQNFANAANLLNLFQLAGGQNLNVGLPPFVQHGQPAPAMAVAQPQGPAGFQVPFPLQAPLAPLAPLAPMAPEALEQPDWLTWGGIIEHFSPGIKVRDILKRRLQTTFQDLQDQNAIGIQTLEALGNYLPRTMGLLKDEKRYTLTCLSFKSCGYVAVDSSTINTRGLLPRGAQGLSGNGNPHNQDLSLMMQRCRDGLLGRIAPCIKDAEIHQLLNVFGMELGWENVYGPLKIAAAEADGVERPGRGRFSGLVETCSPEEKEAVISTFLPQQQTSDAPMGF
ncbi:Fc.00g005770.m01.CDS01 [Cosmosporella sp. VM-42]